MTDFEFNNVRKIIRAYNEKIRYDYKHGKISNAKADFIDEAIPSRFLTKSGNVKAGKKFISGLSSADVDALLSSIESARSYITVSDNIAKFNDNPDLIWKIIDDLRERGTNLSSEQVKSITDNWQNITTASKQNIIDALGSAVADKPGAYQAFDEAFENIEFFINK